MLYRLLVAAILLLGCQAFVPPASGISRAMSIEHNAATAIEMGAKKKLKKKPVKKKVAASVDDNLFYHEGTKGFVGDQINTFVYQIGLASGDDNLFYHEGTKGFVG